MSEKQVARPKSNGWLISVGLGINVGQMTSDARNVIAKADVVFSLATNPISHQILLDLNPNVHSLHVYYSPGKLRPVTYQEMIDAVLTEVRKGKRVCFAAYGHPGVFGYPTHMSVKIAREEGYDAVMLPGVSAEDCLFADLGLDPGTFGCQSFESTDFVFRERIWDPHSLLIIWQVSVIGILTMPKKNEIPRGHKFLIQRLVDVYGSDHPGILYEAASLPLCNPRADEKSLSLLMPKDFRPETTLVIRPLDNCPRANEEFGKLIR